MSRAALIILLASTAASALLLDVRAGGSRCLHEVLSKHDLVKAEYKLEPRAGAAEGERVAFEVRVRPAPRGAAPRRARATPHTREYPQMPAGDGAGRQDGVSGGGRRGRQVFIHCGRGRLALSVRRRADVARNDARCSRTRGPRHARTAARTTYRRSTPTLPRAATPTPPIAPAA